MIRKLKDGKYRLYSRKKDEKTGKRRNLGTFETREAAEKHERRCSISSGIEGVGQVLPFDGFIKRYRGQVAADPSKYYGGNVPKMRHSV